MKIRSVLFALSIFSLLLFFGFRAHAEVTIEPNSSSGIITPFKDFFHTLTATETINQVKQVPQEAQKALDAAKQAQQTVTQATDTIGKIKTWWNTANDWVKVHLGTSLKDILHSAANLVIWVFETLVKAIKWVLGVLHICFF